MMLLRRLVASLFTFAIGTSYAWAQTIVPQADITSITLAGDEISMLDTAIDLNNAHPVGTISFFRRNAHGPAEHIPFELEGDFQPFLLLRSGADCAISGVRAMRNGDILQLVYATRKGGWTDTRAVTFVVFELAWNEEGAPGTPSLYFRRRSQFVSRQAYCDVKRALEKEVPSSGLGAKR